MEQKKKASFGPSKNTNEKREKKKEKDTCKGFLRFLRVYI